MANKNQSLLQQYLKDSTLTPGLYRPSDAVKAASLVGVFAGGKPILMTGASADDVSVEQARTFAQSAVFSDVLKVLKIDGDVQVLSVTGDELSWPETCEAVVASTAGVAEDGAAEGDLMMINLSQYKELTVLLCVTTELAQIIDPQAPELDMGKLVAQFGSEDVQVLDLH